MASLPSTGLLSGCQETLPLTTSLVKRQLPGPGQATGSRAGLGPPCPSSQDLSQPGLLGAHQPSVPPQPCCAQPPWALPGSPPHHSHLIISPLPPGTGGPAPGPPPLSPNPTHPQAFLPAPWVPPFGSTSNCPLAFGHWSEELQYLPL